MQELDRQLRQRIEQAHKRSQRHAQNRDHPGRKAQAKQSSPAGIRQRHHNRHQRQQDQHRQHTRYYQRTGKCRNQNARADQEYGREYPAAPSL
jgi:hypothetical protein